MELKRLIATSFAFMTVENLISFVIFCTLLIFEKKLVCFNVKCISDALYVFKGYAAAEVLYCAYVSSAYTAFFSKHFLGQSGLLTIVLDIRAKNFNYIHIPPLHCIWYNYDGNKSAYNKYYQRFARRCLANLQ